MQLKITEYFYISLAPKVLFILKIDSVIAVYRSLGTPPLVSAARHKVTRKAHLSKLIFWYFSIAENVTEKRCFLLHTFIIGCLSENNY